MINEIKGQNIEPDAGNCTLDLDQMDVNTIKKGDTSRGGKERIYNPSTILFVSKQRQDNGGNNVWIADSKAISEQ